MLQVLVERAAVPERSAGKNIRANSPVAIKTILENIRGGALIALTPGRNDGILFFALPCVSQLEITAILTLSDAEIHKIGVRLPPKILLHCSLRANRVSCCSEVLFGLEEKIDGQPLPRRLELIVQDDIAIHEV